MKGDVGDELVEQGAEGVDDFEVGALVAAADVVGLAEAAAARTARMAVQWSPT